MQDLTILTIPNLIAQDKNIQNHAIKCNGCNYYYGIITQLDVITLEEKVLLQSEHNFNNEEEVFECLNDVKRFYKEVIEN
jgi:hypothetical protein